MTGKRYQSRYRVGVLLPDGVANRAAETADGVSVAMARIEPYMLTPGMASRGATRVVVAADAAPTTKGDYYGDGVADNVAINAALASLPAVGGTVLLSEGNFTIAAPVVTTATRQVLRGQGMGPTVIRAKDSAGAPLNTVMVQVAHDYCEIYDLTIDGNRANNSGASANAMIGLQVWGTRARVTRVRVTGVNVFGMVISNTVQYGVVRDCFIDNHGSNGGNLRAAAGAPLVVEGCTITGNGANGMICDDGPVLISDCVFRNNTAAGLLVGVDGVSVTNCVAEGNGGAGFNAYVGGVPNTQFLGCRATTNADPNFATSGTRTRFVGCLSVMAVGDGKTGFGTQGGSTDAACIGCNAFDGGRGYLHTSTGRVAYVGCQVVTNGYYGFHNNNGEVQARGCRTSGVGSGSYGFVLEGGGNHAVEGSRATNHQGSGLYTGTGVPGVRFVNNYVRDEGLGANNTYQAIVSNSDTAFIDGNMVRDPGSGNRPYAAIGNGGADCQIGINDPFGSGVSIQVNDAGTRTRRMAKVQLTFTPGSDLMASQQTANAWFDLFGNQTFRVDSAASLVEILYRGIIQGGNSGTACQHFTRWVIDSGGTPIYFLAGGNVTEAANTYQNPLAGGQAIKIQGLAIGNHTIKLQGFNWGANSYWYLRPASAPGLEYFSMQVVEYFR